MRWVDEPSLSGDVAAALSHFNATATALGATNACELYFKGFNRLWNALAAYQGEPNRADTPSFIALLLAMDPDRQETLLASNALTNLVALSPEVMDHYILKVHGHRPGQE